MLARYMLRRVSVFRPSVCHKPVLYGNDWTNQLVWGGGFLPPIPDCVIRKYRYVQKLGTSLWDFVPNSGLQKSRHGKSIALSITLVVVVVVDVPACWQHLYDSRRVVTVYYKSVNCNPLTPSLRFVVDCCTACFYSWQDFDWHIASRGPSAVAEFLVVKHHHECVLSTLPQIRHRVVNLMPLKAVAESRYDCVCLQCSKCECEIGERINSNASKTLNRPNETTACIWTTCIIAVGIVTLSRSHRATR